MNGYRVILSDELEHAYQLVAAELSISMEQTLTGALQLFLERMTLECYPGLADDEKLRKKMNHIRATAQFEQNGRSIKAVGTITDIGAENAERPDRGVGAQCGERTY